MEPMKPDRERRPMLPSGQLYGGAVKVREAVSWTMIFLILLDEFVNGWVYLPPYRDANGEGTP